MPIRLGAVSYLNTRPLVYGLETGQTERPVRSAVRRAREVRGAASRERRRPRFDPVDRISRPRLPDRLRHLDCVGRSGGIGCDLQQGSDREYSIACARHELENVDRAAASLVRALVRNRASPCEHVARSRPHAGRVRRGTGHRRQCPFYRPRCAGSRESGPRRRVDRHDRAAVRVCILGGTSRRRWSGRCGGPSKRA